MSLAHYLVQVNLYLIVFYGFYKLLLDKETYFTLNRVYLLSAGILSLAIPFIKLEWFASPETTRHVYTSVNWDEIMAQATIVNETANALNWENAFVSIYFTGVLLFTVRLIFNLLNVKKLVKNTKAGTAFSFLNKKIIDPNLPLATIIDAHEEVHIKQFHTIDILFFELLGAIAWFNPIIYLYKKSIKNIHEFLADELAAHFQGNKAAYAMLILSQSFGIAPNRITNGFFNKSLIKKRIFMLQKERSKKTAIIKYGFFIPLFAILVIFSSATVRKNKQIQALSDQIHLEKPIEALNEMVADKTDTQDRSSSDSVTISPKEQPSENWKNFYSFIARHVKYPEEAIKNNQQGITQVTFNVNNSKIGRIKEVNREQTEFSAEVKNAILSYKQLNSLKDGQYLLNVHFRINSSNLRTPPPPPSEFSSYQKLPDVFVDINLDQTDENDLDDKIHDFVSIEKQPEFPGGIAKFYKYLGKSIKYPSQAIEKNVQGKVFVSFIVEKDGVLSNIQITRGLGSGTDEEAIRVLNESPKWNPGIAKGKVVRVKYNININFSLNTDPPAEVKTGKAIIKTGPSSTFSGAKFEGLVVLNGKESGSGFDLNKIDNRDIASVTVLKDAAATSLYGEKGRKGVLMITTKNNLFKTVTDADIKIDKSSPVIQLRQKF